MVDHNYAKFAENAITSNQQKCILVNRIVHSSVFVELSISGGILSSEFLLAGLYIFIL